MRHTIIVSNQKIDIVFFISILRNCLEHFETKEDILKYKSFVKSFRIKNKKKKIRVIEVRLYNK